MTPYSLVYGYQRFRETRSLNLYPKIPHMNEDLSSKTFHCAVAVQGYQRYVEITFILGVQSGSSRLQEKHL